MELRLHGLSDEVAETVRRLRESFNVVSVSRQYRDRKPSRMVRVYVEVRL